MSSNEEFVDGGWSFLIDGIERAVKTKEEARELFDLYSEAEDGINYYIKVGPLVGENDTSFGARVCRRRGCEEKIV